MIDKEAFYGILGMGQTGVSCAHFLASQGIRFECLDDRPAPPQAAAITEAFPGVATHWGPFEEQVLSRYDILVVSPGLSIHTPVLRRWAEEGKRIIGDIELFALMAKAPVIGITGSNAKGTVTTLVGLMAQRSGYRVEVGGNIGTPALDLLQRAVPHVYVLELSSFQLETTYSLSTQAATILNFCEDHLDRYEGKMDLYVRAKQRIYSGCDHPVYNRDDARTLPKRFTNRPLVSFGLDEPGAGDYGVRWREGEPWLVRGAEYLMAANSLTLKGTHQWSNALAALALGHTIGCPLPAMVDTLRSFQGLPHRCEFLGDHRGRFWFDDSKATNVGAACAAIQGLGAAQAHTDKKIVLIAGGQSKGADLAPLLAPIQTYVRHVVLLGQDAPLLASLLNNTTVPYTSVKDLEEAVSVASNVSLAEDTVLLSPACASLDMFRNYEDRGRQFAALVRAL